MLDSLLFSLNDLPVYIVQKKMHLESLDKAISERQEKIRQTVDEYNISMIDLEEYRANRPLRESIKKFKQIVVDKENEISFLQKELREYKLDLHIEKNSRSVVETEFDEVNKKLSTDHPLNMEELVTITDEVFYHPSRNA